MLNQCLINGSNFHYENNKTILISYRDSNFALTFLFLFSFFFSFFFFLDFALRVSKYEALQWVEIQCYGLDVKSPSQRLLC
jgi:hypothetical protein